MEPLPHTPEPDTGDNLARELVERRAEAFERLYAQLHGRLFNLAARILGDTDEAADATQDAFLKAFRGMPALPTAGDAQRWMYRVTVNTCYDHLRRRRAAGAAPLHELDDVPSRGDPFEAAQLAGSVEAALAGLSPRYRTALVLKELHGLGNHEVADAMGISRGAAGVLLLRARAAFRRAFGKASPAGAGRALGLAALLPMLPVPAALQTPPSFVPAPAAGMPAGALPAPAAGAPLAGIAPAAGGPVAGGLLAKLGAATAGKVALAVLGISAVAVGGVAVRSADQGGNGSFGEAAPGTALTHQRAGGGHHPGAVLAGEPAKLRRLQAYYDDLSRNGLRGQAGSAAAGAGNGQASGPGGGEPSGESAGSGSATPGGRDPAATPGGSGGGSGGASDSTGASDSGEEAAAEGAGEPGGETGGALEAGAADEGRDRP